MSETVVRGCALALRDMAEAAGASEASLTVGGLTITWDADNGLHVIAPEGDPIPADEWAENPGLEPVPGVTSVRQQIELLAVRHGD